jgi:hypothetical protein
VEVLRFGTANRHAVRISRALKTVYIVYTVQLPPFPTMPTKKAVAAKRTPSRTPAKRAPARQAAAKPAPARRAAAKKAAVKAPSAPEVASKPPKTKLVRDSFTIPKAEYAVLDQLKQRAAQLTHGVKKSELLRAGLKALAAMNDADFLAAVKAVPSIKTGRPKARKAAEASPTA